MPVSGADLRWAHRCRALIAATLVVVATACADSERATQVGGEPAPTPTLTSHTAPLAKPPGPGDR